MSQPMFLTIPMGYDPQTYMLLNRMSLYIKALEGALMQQGIVGFGEVEKSAKRSEALQAIEGIEQTLQSTRSAIENLADPIQRIENVKKWDASDEKAALEQALNQYREQLAETFSD